MENTMVDNALVFVGGYTVVLSVQRNDKGQEVLHGVPIPGKWLAAEYEWFQPAFSVVLKPGQPDEKPKPMAPVEGYAVPVDHDEVSDTIEVEETE